MPAAHLSVPSSARSQQSGPMWMTVGSSWHEQMHRSPRCTAAMRFFVSASSLATRSSSSFIYDSPMHSAPGLPTGAQTRHCGARIIGFDKTFDARRPQDSAHEGSKYPTQPPVVLERGRVLDLRTV